MFVSAHRIKSCAHILTCLLIAQMCTIGVSCQSSESRIECLNKAVDLMIEDKASQNILSAFQDTMQVWKKSKLRAASFYYDNMVKVDAVMMDSARRRGIIVVLVIDTSAGSKVDVVKIYGTNEVGGLRYFYSSGLPSIGVAKPEAPSNYFDEFSIISKEWKIAASDNDYFDCTHLKMREKFFDELLYPKKRLEHERFREERDGLPNLSK